jgi:hypothetical protein
MEPAGQAAGSHDLTPRQRFISALEGRPLKAGCHTWRYEGNYPLPQVPILPHRKSLLKGDR